MRKKTAKQKKMGNSKRAKDYRTKLKEKGGKLVQIPLDKEGVERFERLREVYSAYTAGQLVGFALKVLEEHTKKVTAKSITE